MGTSAAYTAPTSGGWPTAKGLATRFARQGGTLGGPIQPETVIRSYVHALGGASAAADSALSAQTATHRLARFLTSTATLGLNTTLQQEGLAALSGSDTTDILAALVTHFTGSARTREETVAMAAMSTVLEDAFDPAQTPAELEESFGQRLDANGIDER